MKTTINLLKGLLVFGAATSGMMLDSTTMIPTIICAACLLLLAPLVCVTPGRESK